MKKKHILILDNIRSVHNVGSLFRTADGAGFSSVFLAGTTPAPIDRFGRKRNDFAKVSLGAEESILWKYFETTKDAIEEAVREGYEIVALEQSSRSIPFDQYQGKKHTALVLGEETKGLSPELLAMCDSILEIPMRGNKESLNVSVAGGIAMYQIGKGE